MVEQFLRSFVLGAVVTAHQGNAATPTPEPVQIYVAPGVPVPYATGGKLIFASSKLDGSRSNFFSHNWCDATTWYQQATRVVDETATDSGGHTTYALENANVIDTYHGKITGEDALLDADGHSFRAVVKVDGTTKTERDPHVGSGGDYTINYATGEVTFGSALDPSAVVTATYHYAGSSLFTFGPTAGKTLTLDLAEVQFSTNVVVTDTVRFNAFGLVDVFAPELMPGVPSGTKIPLGADFVYKTFFDYLNDSLRSYPVVPAMGGGSWRGSPESMILDWDYVRATQLFSAAGMEIRVWLEHDIPFGGSCATVTFYCGSATS